MHRVRVHRSISSAMPSVDIVAVCVIIILWHEFRYNYQLTPLRQSLCRPWAALAYGQLIVEALAT